MDSTILWELAIGNRTSHSFINILDTCTVFVTDNANRTSKSICYNSIFYKLTVDTLGYASSTHCKISNLENV